MKRGFLYALLASVLGLPAEAALESGTTAPMFTTQASLGGKEFTFSLADALKNGPVVLYFYPKAFTSGCTVEAHEFAEAMDDFKSLGATVIGISNDDIKTLNKFSVSECQSKFPVGADEGGKVIRSYDAALLFSYANRMSYVIAPDGKVIYSYTALDPSQHVANTMAAVKAWRANQTKG
jgi:thioredoxin-dependent peroxiredoxin